MKNMARIALLGLSALGLWGCAHGGEDVYQRGWSHTEWHVLGAYKEFVGLHEDFDRYFFNLDTRNPDRY